MPDDAAPSSTNAGSRPPIGPPAARIAEIPIAEMPIAKIAALDPVEIKTPPLAELVSDAEIIPPPQDLSDMTESKPLKDSKTAQSSILVVLLAVWSPLMITLDAVLGFFGIPLDAASWSTFSDDGVIARGELLAILRDVVMAGLALAAVFFRKRATSTIKGVFSRD